MAQHFKKIIKKGNPKIREVSLVISQYLKDIGFIEMSPIEIFKESTKEELTHNYILARAFYGKQYGVRFNKKNAKQPTKIRNKYWMDYDWNVFKYSPKTLTWEPITTPMYPGTRNIFTDENKTTTEDIHQKIAKIEETEKDNLTVEDLEKIDKFIKEY